MGSTQNQNMEQLVANTKAKLKVVENYQQVYDLLYEVVTELRINNSKTCDVFTGELQKRIEAVSPIDCNSTQWSCYRYALVLLRQLSSPQGSAVKRRLIQ